MKEVIAFRDMLGNVHKTAETCLLADKAIKLERAIARRVKKAMAPLGPEHKSKNCDFANGEGWIHHNPDAWKTCPYVNTASCLGCGARRACTKGLPQIPEIWEIARELNKLGVTLELSDNSPYDPVLVLRGDFVGYVGKRTKGRL